MDKVSVIPNAVDTDVFRPPEKRGEAAIRSPSLGNGHSRTSSYGIGGAAVSPPRKRLTVVIGSRLVYRKGIDLVAVVVPQICDRRFGPNRDVLVDFMIAGRNVLIIV